MLNLLFVLLLFAQPDLPEPTCEELEGYLKSAEQVCLLQEDMNDDQILLFRALQRAEHQLTQALHTQQEFNIVAVNSRRNNFNIRIIVLGNRRDATTGHPQQIYQNQIDQLIEKRDFFDSTELDSPRDKASKLGPVISQLRQNINELKRDLDASIL